MGQKLAKTSMETTMSNLPVVIIGAGCAGLSAAYTLKKQGIDAVVYEASGVVGGRCRSVYEDGYEFYAGAGSTEPQWTTTFTYLKELGLSDRVRRQAGVRYGFPLNGKIRTVPLGGTPLQMLAAVPELVEFLFRGWPLKTYPQLLRTFKALSPYMKGVDTKKHDFASLREISNQSTADFVLKHGGQEALDYFFHCLLATMVLGRPKDISIAHPIALFSLMGGMCTLDGGMGIITAGLYEKVKDQVRLNTPVTKVVVEDGKVTGVETSEGFVAADQVICCVDAHVARQIIPDLPDTMRKPLETCNYSSTYYYQFGLEKPAVASGHPHQPDVIMIPDTVDSVLNFISLGSPSTTHPIVVVGTRSWSPALDAMTPEERRRVVITEIQRFWPQFPTEPRKTKLFHWDRAVNLESPGQLVAINNLLDHHMDDIPGLHLAGEYLFIIACTEGALATGKDAAEKVAQLVRVPAATPAGSSER